MSSIMGMLEVVESDFSVNTCMGLVLAFLYVVAHFLLEWKFVVKLVRRLGMWCLGRIYRVDAWCREPVRMSGLPSGTLVAREARGQRQRDRRLHKRLVRRVEEQIVDVPAPPTFEECDSLLSCGTDRPCFWTADGRAVGGGAKVCVSKHNPAGMR